MGVDLQVPGPFLDEDARLVVQQKPAERIKILAPLGRIERQREIAAALGNAIFAQALARRQIFAPRLG
jgi:hypothetical protein